MAWGLADRRNRRTEAAPTVPAEALLALSTINRILRWVTRQYFRAENPGALERCRGWAADRIGPEELEHLDRTFVELFPPVAVPLAVAGLMLALVQTTWILGAGEDSGHSASTR